MKSLVSSKSLRVKLKKKQNQNDTGLNQKEYLLFFSHFWVNLQSANSFQLNPLPRVNKPVLSIVCDKEGRKRKKKQNPTD